MAGTGRTEKADSLAQRLKEVLGDEATVSRPVVKGELRIRDLDDSVSADEVARMVAEYGSCLPTEVRVGPFTRMTNSLDMIWVQCTINAAIKVVAPGRVRMG